MARIAKPLSDMQIQKAKANNGKRKFLYDGRGLRVVIHPSGTKSFEFQYKNLDKKDSTITLGHYLSKIAAENHPDSEGVGGMLTLLEARRKASEYNAMIALGRSPKISFSTKKSHIFREVANEYIDAQKFDEAHLKRVVSRMKKDIFPVIGGMDVRNIKRADIKSIADKVYKRGASDVTKRICQTCDSIFEFSINAGYCEGNPASNLSRNYKKERSIPFAHFDNDEALRAYVRALYVEKNKDMKYCYVMLSLLLFCRPSELREAKWSNVDLSRGIMIVEVERNKMRTGSLEVMLSTQAIGVFQLLKALCFASKYIFPSPQCINKAISSPPMLSKARSYTDEDISLHGFRHAFSTMSHEMGYNTLHIEACLNHKDLNNTRDTYNMATFRISKKKMMQDWADYLDNLAEIGVG